MAGLGTQRFVSITTLRRDGRPVAAPVWVVAATGRLYVWTGSETGKAKRIRSAELCRLSARTLPRIKGGD